MDTNQNFADLTEKEESELEGKYLTFWTDGQLFAIPIANVMQIVQMQEITEIPEFPMYAKGVIDLRVQYKFHIFCHKFNTNKMLSPDYHNIFLYDSLLFF